MATPEFSHGRNGRWVTCWRVWHWRAKRYVYRHDGKPFRFRIG